MKAIEKLKVIARKAYNIRASDKGNRINLIILKKLVDDIFNKLLREFTDVIFEQQDRIMHVLCKNIQKAIERKQQAIHKFLNIQSELSKEAESFKHVIPEENNNTWKISKNLFHIDEEEKEEKKFTEDEEQFMNCEVFADEFTTNELFANLPHSPMFNNK